MRKFLAIAISAVALFGLLGAVDALAAAFLPVQGGTGTSIIPASGTIPIGNGIGTYTPALLTPGSNIQITNASGSITIAVTGTATGTVYVLNAGHGISLTPAQITASGTIAVNTSTLIADVVASGQFLASSTTYVVSVNGASGAVTLGIPATTTINGVSQQFTFTPAFSGSSFTIATSVSGGSSTITFTIPRNLSAFTNDSGYLTTSTGLTTANFATTSISQWVNDAHYVTSTSGGTPTTTLNGFTGTVFQILAGQGETSTIVNGSTTLTLNLGTGCSGNNFVSTISPTGTITCATPSGGASSTNVFGVSPIVVNQVGVNATVTFNTSTALSWGGLQTFLAGVTHNSTTTFNSSTIFSYATGTLLSTNASGTVQTTTFGGTGLSFSGNTLTWTNPGYITSAPATATITSAGFTWNSPFTFATTTGISISSSSGNITFGNTGVTSNVAGSNISVSGATGAVTINFVNPGFVTAASSVVWTGLQTFNATATFNSSTQFTSLTSQNCLGTNASGTLIVGTCGGGTTNINGISSSTFSFLAGSNLSVASSASPNNITYSFVNPGFVTAASSVTWTAAQTFNATTTLAGNVSTTIPSKLLLTNASGVIIGYPGSGSCGAGNAVDQIQVDGEVHCQTFGVASTTATIYVDGNRTDAYTPNGTYVFPYKTMDTAIAAASSSGFGQVAFVLSPSVYVSGAPVLFPNIPFTITGNQSTWIVPSGVTMPNSFDIDSLTIVGNVIESDTALTAIHQFTNGVITGGNLTVFGNATLGGMTFPSTTSTIIAGTSSILTAVNNYFTNTFTISSGSLLNLDADGLFASTTGYVITGLAHSQLTMNGGTIVNPSGDGIDLHAAANTASAPNEISNVSVVIGATATSTIWSGTSQTLITDVAGLTDVVGGFHAPSGTAFSAGYDMNKAILNAFSFGTSTMTTGQATFVGTVNQSGGLVSLASTTITGQATTTGLTVTGLAAGTNCVHEVNGVIGTISGDCGSATGGTGTVTTSSQVTIYNVPVWNATNGSGLNGTSSITFDGASTSISTGLTVLGNGNFGGNQLTAGTLTGNPGGTLFIPGASGKGVDITNNGESAGIFVTAAGGLEIDAPTPSSTRFVNIGAGKSMYLDLSLLTNNVVIAPPNASGTLALTTSTVVGDCVKSLATYTITDAGFPCGSSNISTSTANIWSALQTFTGGATFNSTTTFNSSTIVLGSMAVGTSTLSGALNVVGTAIITGTLRNPGYGNSLVSVNGSGNFEGVGSTPAPLNFSGNTLSWSNTPGFVTSASSVTWTAAQTFVATTTFASTTILSGSVSSTEAAQLIYATGTTGLWQGLTLGTNLSITGSTLNAASTAAAGTVTTSTLVSTGYYPFWGTASALTGTSSIEAVGGGANTSTVVLGNLSVGTSTTSTNALFVNGNTQTQTVNEPVFDNGSSTNATTSINWNNGNKQEVAIATGTTQFLFSNAKSGGSYSLWVMQDNSGSRLATWQTTGTDYVVWSSSTIPTLTTTANNMDEFSFQCFVPHTTTTLTCFGQYGQNNFVQ